MSDLRNKIYKIANSLLENDLKIVSQNLEMMKQAKDNILVQIEVMKEELQTIKTKLNENRIYVNYDDIDYAFEQLKEIESKIGKYSVFSYFSLSMSEKLKNDYGITEENNKKLDRNIPTQL